MATPKIFHQTWKDRESIPETAKVCMDSWKRNHPDWEFKFYSDIDNIDLVTKNYPELLSLYTGFKYSIQRVDLIRYLYLKTYGGVYTDIDILCYRPLDFLENKLVFTSLHDDTKHVSNAFMASELNNPFWDILLEDVLIKSKERLTGNKILDVNNTTGAGILSRSLRKIKTKHILPRKAFHQFQWNERHSASIETPKIIPKGQYGVHLYSSTWI